jgi:AcrR family transcriptional regulator
LARGNHIVTKRNPEAAQRRILDAAAKAFAADGPAGARIDTIAVDARVNKRMLYHYFGDKRALFVAVLADRLERGQVPGSASAMIDDSQPAAVLDLRLMVWSAISQIGPGLEYAQSWRQLVAEMVSLQEAGQLRGDVDAQILAVLMFAVSAVPELLSGYVGLPTADEQSAWSRSSGPLLRKLMAVPASDQQRLRVRPRVRMLPDVLDG